MKIVEIVALENGAHRNQNGDTRAVPAGWAVIPDTLATENFPFGEVTAEEIDGVMTATDWVPSEIPEPEPAPEVEHEPTDTEVINALLGVNE